MPAEARTATKVDPSTMDPSKKGIAYATPPEAEVEGQRMEYTPLICPCYGHITYAWVDTTVYNWYECDQDGCSFQA